MRREPSKAARDAGTLLALFGLVIVAGCLLALVALVLPQALGVIVVVGLFIVLGAVQYATWGIWLIRNPPPEEHTDNRAPHDDI